MKKATLGNLLALIALCPVLFIPVRGDETRNAKSQLTVPWEEFKKIIRIDENEIVLPLETFNRLVAQTGVRTPPRHAVREGLVVMRRAEFQQLVNDMKTPADSSAVPPFDYLITRAEYFGIMGNNGTRFTARFRVHVLKNNAYLKIPLLYQNLALEDMKVDGRSALVVSEGGYHQAVFAKQGEHVVEATFSIRSNLDRGPFRLDLSILQTPITLLRLELPLRGVDVEIPQAQTVSVVQGGAGTVVTAVIAPGGSIGVAWRKKAPAHEKLPPKLYAEVNHLLSIEDDALRLNSDVVFNILHSEIDEVSLIVPDDWNVLGVSGEGVGEWREKAQGGRRTIWVPFTYGRQGSAVVNVSAEKPISDRGVSNSFTGFRVPDAVRETGYIGVELNTGAEVKVADSRALERVSVTKLPQMLYNKSVKPLILAYKYLRHPFSLMLDVEKHEKISVPLASAVSANAVTLFTEDGKIVHRLIYQIRNSEKQFLEIRLPKDADVWSVFVGGEAVESSLGSDGRLLVPLIRSRYSGSLLETFPVEVIYCLVGKPFSLLGWRGAGLPSADVMTSQIFWSVYVPNDYAYLYFKSSLEKEEIIRGLNLLGSKRRLLSVDRSAPSVGSAEPEKAERNAKELYKGKDYRSRFRNVPMEESQVAQQLDAEMNFGSKLDELAQAPAQGIVRSGGAGVLPIQIAIPTTGQVYRFARTIVRSGDPLTVGVLYARSGLVTFVLWVVFFAILWVAYRTRKTLRRGFNRLSEKWRTLRPALARLNRSMPQMSGWKKALYALAVLAVIFWFVSKLLFLMILFTIWVVVMVRVYIHLRNREKGGKKEQKRKRRK